VRPSARLLAAFALAGIVTAAPAPAPAQAASDLTVTPVVTGLNNP